MPGAILKVELDNDEFYYTGYFRRYEKMKKYIVYIGLNDGRTGKQQQEYKWYENFIIESLSNHSISGATLFNATGIWNGERENTIVVEIVDSENNLEVNINRFIKDIKMFFHQNAIMTEVFDSNIRFD